MLLDFLKWSYIHTDIHTAQINSHYNYKIEMIIISFLSISEDAGRYSSPELGHELELSFHGLLDIFERGNEPRKLYKEKKMQLQVQS